MSNILMTTKAVARVFNNPTRIIDPALYMEFAAEGIRGVSCKSPARQPVQNDAALTHLDFN